MVAHLIEFVCLSDIKVVYSIGWIVTKFVVQVCCVHYSMDCNQISHAGLLCLFDNPSRIGLETFAPPRPLPSFVLPNINIFYSVHSLRGTTDGFLCPV